MKEVERLITEYSCHKESMVRLEKFVQLLTKWSKAYNLIGPNELPFIWERHILDSLQLIHHMPPPNSNPKIIDLGSGAGFPGVVLAFLGYSNIFLVERSQKKATFLETVSRETEVDFTVVNNRIEDSYEVLGKADIVTSRALADLKTLLGYSKRLLNSTGCSLFLKGEKLQDEIDVALQNFKFNYTIENKKIIRIYGEIFPLA